MMPGMDGMELARQVRLLPAHRDVPLIVLTSGGDLGLDMPLRALGIRRSCPSLFASPTSCGALLGDRTDVQDVLQRSRRRDAKTSPASAPIPRSDGSLRILLAEDNPVNQKVVSIMLQQRGHEVTVVDDGGKAVEACRGNRFDVVLMDIQMPEMDGFEALASIRSTRTQLRRDHAHHCPHGPRHEGRSGAVPGCRL